MNFLKESKFTRLACTPTTGHNVVSTPEVALAAPSNPNRNPFPNFFPFTTLVLPVVKV